MSQHRLFTDTGHPGTVPRPRQTADTSRRAYKRQKAREEAQAERHADVYDLRLGTQKAQVLKCLVFADRPLTNSEIEARTGIRINAVCGRVNDLLKDGLIRYGDERRCRITGEVAQVRVVPDAVADALRERLDTMHHGGRDD
ncbi:MAG: hypothetical protein GVY12_12610 [Bacteroidetes bacterium]|jgi:hypothetical protein|nr:hypothetical protein [Bacteroidota bacterium]